MDLSTISSWFKKVPSKIWLGVIVILLLVAAFAAGRYTLPAKVITKTETVTVEKEKIVTVTQVVEKKVYIKQKAEDVHTETVETKKPDGTVITETKQDVHEKDTTVQASTQESQTSTKTDLAITEDAKSSKIVINQAQWHLRLDGGLGARFVGQTTPILVLGAGVERRIFGPLFIGIWAQTTLNLVAPSTPPYEIAGGISIGFEL